MARSRRHFSDGPTPEQIAHNERAARSRERSRRRQCDFLRFWQECRQPRCRRNHSCSGKNPEECFRVNWALVPDDQKEWWRGVILAGANGARTCEALARAGDKRRAEYFERLEWQERYREMVRTGRPADAEPAAFGVEKPPVRSG